MLKLPIITKDNMMKPIHPGVSSNVK